MFVFYFWRLLLEATPRLSEHNPQPAQEGLTVEFLCFRGDLCETVALEKVTSVACSGDTPCSFGRQLAPLRVPADLPNFICSSPRFAPRMAVHLNAPNAPTFSPAFELEGLMGTWCVFPSRDAPTICAELQPDPFAGTSRTRRSRYGRSVSRPASPVSLSARSAAPGRTRKT